MTTKRFAVVALALCALAASAQTPPPVPGTPVGGTAGRRVYFHGPVGQWWKNSETAKKLQLTENQVAQLDQIFYEHKMKLIDYGADMEKQDLKLQTLLDADIPDEGQINSQVDQTLAARGKLEREYTTMNLDLRRVLSPDQWRQLKAIRGEHGDRFIFFQKKVGPPSKTGPGPETMPLPEQGFSWEGASPLPPPIPDETF